MQRQWQKRQTRPRIFFTLALPVLVAMLAGCSNSQKAPVPAAAPASTSTQRQPIVSATTGTALLKMEEKPVEVFSYRPSGRRDPFAPIVTKQEKKSRISDLPPLERYNISEFKLSGIVWGGFGYNAVLEGPDGKGYFIRVGTILGPNRGVVKKITQNMIVIEEKFKNVMGETERKEITVQLRKKQEEKP
ncbi:MAG TPA: pilus assembly protein PilP [Nitrospirota bacterium]|nr:pilus assembly protein PilP [Nitrospirota bacterium]